jgi:hypothetical protein
MLNKTKVMTLSVDGEGNIVIPGAEYVSRSMNIHVGYGPLEPRPGAGKGETNPVFAIAIPHDEASNEYVVMANGDDGSWDIIDPGNVGVKPKDMESTYRFWSLDAEYDDSEVNKVKLKGLHREYDSDLVPDWNNTQYITVSDPVLGDVSALVTKAKATINKNLAGWQLPSAVEAEYEEG